MWDLPNPGIDPMSPASAGGFFPTEPPGKPSPPFLQRYDPLHRHPPPLKHLPPLGLRQRARQRNPKVSAIYTQEGRQATEKRTWDRRSVQAEGSEEGCAEQGDGENRARGAL